MPQLRINTGRIEVVFWLELVYLIVLFALALVYVTGSQLPLWNVKIPDSLGPVPIGVPWFGALGGVMVSLSGVFDHRGDWQMGLKYWHFSRPFIGVALGVVAVLVFQAGMLAVNSRPTPTGGATGNLLYYLIAFLVGYREETFRELIKRVGDVILTPGGGPPPPVVVNVDPASGAIAGGDKVTITGSGFTGATEVRFGQKPAVPFTVDSDGQITTTSPKADAAGKVSVSVTTKQGTGTGGEFTYQ